MKRLLTKIALFIVLFGIGISGINVKASNKEYNIESAEFNVYLDENCNADRKEKWNLNFKKGDFSRFKVSRLLNPNELEKFDDIEFKDFKNNNSNCLEAEDIEKRPEGTYSLSKSDNLLEYAWYFKANNEKLILEDNYKLINLVKYTDSGYALFCYRFIGEDFEKDIDNLKIVINMPSKGNIEIRHDSDMKYEIFDNRVELNKNNSSGMVKINVAMDKNMFSNNIGYISEETLDKIYESENSAEEFSEFFFMGIAAIFVTFIIWILYVYLKKVRLAKDETYVRNAVNKLINDAITPYEFSRLCGVYRVYFNEFKLVFLDLLRRDVFRISEDKIYMNHNLIYDLRDYEVKVFDLLYESKKTDEDRSFITMDDLLNIMKDNDKIIDLMYKCDSQRIESYRKENKKIIDVLKIYYKNYAVGYTRDLEEVIEKYLSDNLIELENLYYMASVVDTTSVKEDSDYEVSVWGYMNFHSFYYIDNSSSSNSSGCASCSSCSGCGGGGAD